MRHFSIRIASRLELHCMSSRIVIVAVAIAPFAYAADLSAQMAPGAAPDLAPRLKLAPTLPVRLPSATRFSCARTGSKATERNGSKAKARSSCVRAGRPCSPTGCTTTSRPRSSGERATCSCGAASTGSPVPRRSSSEETKPGSSPRLFFTSAKTRRAAMPAKSSLRAPTSTSSRTFGTPRASRATTTGTSRRQVSISTARGW